MINHPHRRQYPFALFRLALVWLMTVTVAASASAQPRSKRPDPKLQPREVTLKTRDGMKLRAFYFPSDKGKEAIPVLLIHEWQGQASPYAPIVVALQKAGCAVLAPDYRGHGKSRDAVDLRGREITLDPTTMKPADVAAIVGQDMEAAKAFLKEENNEGNLNLNALVLIAVREGCVFATNWAVNDWRFPSIGSNKQGQDVKGLVLISPEKVIRGFAIDRALRDPSLIRLPMMIVAGAESPEASEAERIGKLVEGIKKRFGGGTAEGFELVLADTNLSGPRLVKDSQQVQSSVVEFIKSNIEINDETNPWIERN